MNTLLVYWLLLIIVIIITLIFIYVRGFRLIDFIIYLTLVAVSQMSHEIFSDYFKLFKYIDLNSKNNIIYALLYDLFVYSAIGIWFSILFPKTINIKTLSIYSVKWISFLVIIEVFIFKQFGIIVYTGWEIFPHSLLFYILSIPISVLYYLIILFIFKRHYHSI